MNTYGFRIIYFVCGKSSSALLMELGGYVDLYLMLFGQNVDVKYNYLS
jgi:hypothetical protein